MGVWSPISLSLLQTAPSLPPFKITNVKPYPQPLGMCEGIAAVTAGLQEQGAVVQFSPVACL